MLQIPEHLKPRVAARLKSPANLGLIVWVEQAPDGVWIVHAHTAKVAEACMAKAELEGRACALAADVLK